jgi:hypothetical protein
MESYLVLYREPHTPSSYPPLSFRCLAYDRADAKSQCMMMGGDRQIVWVGTFLDSVLDR